MNFRARKHSYLPITPKTTIIGGKYTFVNYELGMLAARQLFVRGIQAMCSSRIFIGSWEQELIYYTPPYESNRAGEAAFTLDVIATFCTPQSAYHAAFSRLYLNGGDKDFLWEPNHCGSCLCLDGGESLSLHCDMGGDGNIRLIKDGHGACVENEFRQKVAIVPWGKLAEQLQRDAGRGY